MSFKTKIKVAGKERNILNVNYAMFQETDATGRPSSISRGGQIEITVEGTGEMDLFEWMTNNFERKDGSIVFLKRDSDATLKELQFSEAYIVSYPLTETFILSAKTIKLGTGEHVNEWV
jgi:hypothetical protein